VLSICLVAGALHAAGVVLLDGRVHIPRSVSLAAVGATAALLLAGFALAHPVRRFDEFKRPQAADAYAAGNNSGVIEEHLLSTGGNARWQLWASALDAFQREPLHGMGAGSFEEWWAQHGTVAGFVRDAHSLYAETLGELGIVGLALLLGFFGAALGGGIVRYAAGYDESRLLHAALLATFAAFAAGAAVDWIWELGAVGAVGIATLTLATASPTAYRSAYLPLRIVLPATACVIIVLETVPFLAQAGIQDSQAALSRGNFSQALARAADARDVQPWAASPYVQLVLVEERAGNFAAARRSLKRALDRDPQDWRVWLISTRIETRAGRIGAARASLTRARALNPRSPLFQSLQG